MQQYRIKKKRKKEIQTELEEVKENQKQIYLPYVICKNQAEKYNFNLNPIASYGYYQGYEAALLWVLGELEK